MQMPSSELFRLHPDVAGIIAKYAKLDGQLKASYDDLGTYLKDGIANGIFPCKKSHVESVIEKIPELTWQTSEEPQVMLITGKRALIALNSFMFLGKSVLEDETFFCSKALFIIANIPANSYSGHQATTKVQIYSKGKFSVHCEEQFDSIASLNKFLTLELLTLECDREFDALLVDVGLRCPELGRINFAVTPRVEATIKELLELPQQFNSMHRHNLCLLLHYFSPNIGNESDMERKAAECELNYVCNLAERSQLLLMCEYRRDRFDDVASSVKRCEDYAFVRACYYTQWQWDGLSEFKPELESLLEKRLHKRTTQLAKNAAKELALPFKVVHQIKQNIGLGRNVANNHKRSRNEYQDDITKLQAYAKRLGDGFDRMTRKKLAEMSEAVAQHLRIGKVRNRIIQSILSRAPELRGSTAHKVEITFLEVVAAEIRSWNDEGTKVLNMADEEVRSQKIQRFAELCEKARDIPEIILVSNDMLTSDSGSSSSSTDANATISSFIDDMVKKQLRSGRLENFAAGIAAPLWVPLAAITMAIIAPVIGAQKGLLSDEKFQSELRGMAQDFLDRLDASLIQTQFFARVQKRLSEDARKLRSFVEYYCVMPADQAAQVHARLNDLDLTQHLVDLEEKLQYIHSRLMMLQVVDLMCDVMTREECKNLGLDMDATCADQLGEIVDKRKVYIVAPPNSAERPLALKLAATGQDSHQLMVEIDILKTVSAEKHANIIPWLGTVYFPRLNAIGFLTYKYNCDLWQFLEQRQSQAVPYKHLPKSPERGEAFVICRNTCDQIFIAVHTLHSKQILHRDLKPDNILVEIQCDMPLRIVIKLCDFGMSKHESEMSGSTRGGTSGYMAPEIQLPKPLFSNKSDIYALGVIAWECFFGLRARDNPGALKSMKTGDEGLWDYLVYTTTLENRVERPTIEQCRMLLREYEKKADNCSVMFESFTSKSNSSYSFPSMMDSISTLKTGVPRSISSSKK